MNLCAYNLYCCMNCFVNEYQERFGFWKMFTLIFCRPTGQLLQSNAFSLILVCIHWGMSKYNKSWKDNTNLPYIVYKRTNEPTRLSSVGVAGSYETNFRLLAYQLYRHFKWRCKLHARHPGRPSLQKLIMVFICLLFFRSEYIYECHIFCKSKLQ